MKMKEFLGGDFCFALRSWGRLTCKEKGGAGKLKKDDRDDGK